MSYQYVYVMKDLSKTYPRWEEGVGEYVFVLFARREDWCTWAQRCG